MAPIAACEFARFHIEETQRTDGLAVGRAQRRAGVETKASPSDPGVTGKAPISREVFNNSDLVLRDHVAAYRNIPRGLPRFGQISRQASVALEEKTMPINERDQCHRHLEDAGELCDDAIESRLGFGIEQLEFGERGKPLLFVVGYGRLGHLLGEQRRGLGDLVQRFGKRDDHLIRAGIAQTPSCLGNVFRRTPESNDDLHFWKSGAHFFAQISRVNDRRRRYN